MVAISGIDFKLSFQYIFLLFIGEKVPFLSRLVKILPGIIASAMHSATLGLPIEYDDDDDEEEEEEEEEEGEEEEEFGSFLHAVQPSFMGKITPTVESVMVTLLNDDEMCTQKQSKANNEQYRTIFGKGCL